MRSIYQYSNMAPRLLGQISIFGMFSLYPSLFGELGDKCTLQYRQDHARTLIGQKPMFHQSVKDTKSQCVLLFCTLKMYIIKQIGGLSRVLHRHITLRTFEYTREL